jgi:hypothetical protein
MAGVCRPNAVAMTPTSASGQLHSHTPSVTWCPGSPSRGGNRGPSRPWDMSRRPSGAVGASSAASTTVIARRPADSPNIGKMTCDEDPLGTDAR